MVNAILILLAINLISFLTFLIRKGLDDEHWGGISIGDELSVILAIGGSFGAFIAMKVNKVGIEDDASFKIAIPVSIIILLFIITVLIVGGIQRRRENKLLGKQNKNDDVLGTVRRAMGASVFRGLPTDITGMSPSGHFQKPDVSFDEEAEEEYTAKYEK